ncbi:MAG: HEAT repeat domain-containing protein [Spirochaetia bacterium]|nr:HEAT repeat domain-containing protein [Spirochaetia bacterium]
MFRKLITVIFILFFIQNYLYAQAIDELPDLDDDLTIDSTTDDNNDEIKQNKDNNKHETKNKKDINLDEEKIERIQQVLKYGNSSQIRDVIGKIASISESDQQKFIGELKNLISVNDPLLRQKIVELLKVVKWKDLDIDIIDFLNTEDNTLLYATAQTIKIKKPKNADTVAAKKLKNCKFDKADNIITTLITILSEYKNTEIADFLFEKLKEENTYKNNKSAIIRYFGNVSYNKKEVIDYLEELVANKMYDELLRSYSAYSLGKMNNQSSVKILRETFSNINSIKNPEEKSRYARLMIFLIGSLIQLNDAEMLPLLVEMTRNDNPSVRVRAIKHLADLNLKENKELLEYKEKYDPNERVRKEAAKALEKMGFKEKKNKKDT